MGSLYKVYIMVAVYVSLVGPTSLLHLVPIRVCACGFHMDRGCKPPPHPFRMGCQYRTNTNTQLGAATLPPCFKYIPFKNHVFSFLLSVWCIWTRFFKSKIHPSLERMKVVPKFGSSCLLLISAC